MRPTPPSHLAAIYLAHKSAAKWTYTAGFSTEAVCALHVASAPASSLRATPPPRYRRWPHKNGLVHAGRTIHHADQTCISGPLACDE
eukprot:CAMPEP_0181192348 /NCGR_PEP_ID=MMETSP1096-20121128/13236_1 /TAXON_ID=156174 ORGANISM="Chrysochromulina ericina, Strain CCMP281" /NCGR_SAMPLE_ID=MMETSP1096 /ASSEMBLY_ACC=CAM_ASM_000453 /LENGTH=86 /DNA_ID=CAMNT_0023281739 /DNA_START=299 /DNA_END=559 /DNA_ORIENTATION=+